MLSAVAASKARDWPFMLQMTINALNEHEIERFAMEGAKLGATRLSFGMTQATGTYLDDALHLPAARWSRITDEIERLACAVRVPITYTDGFPRRSPVYECEPFRSEILHVDFHGHMNLCCQHADVPAEDPARDRLVDLRKGSLIDGHRAMLARISEVRTAKLDAIEAGTLDAWDHFPCNFCMRALGKPHWTDEGAAGPGAGRERWNGAWARKRHDRPVPMKVLR